MFTDFITSLSEQRSYTSDDDDLKRILSMPSVAQRTPEWYEARKTLITASACADVLGCNPYRRNSRQEVLYEKANPHLASQQNNNIYMMHGTLFEPIASKLYEHVHAVKMHEIGLLRHPNIPFIGASPDGLVTRGRMVEIKCPVKRKLVKKGAINGDICPTHYWVQIQIQLEVCDLEICDFWQCRFVGKTDLSEWLHWNPTQIPGYAGPYKGVICFKDNDTPVYPPRLFDNEWQYAAWIMTVLPVTRVLYWVLEDCFNQTVSRDREWFSQIALPQLSTFWNEVQNAKTLTFDSCL